MDIIEVQYPEEAIAESVAKKEKKKRTGDAILRVYEILLFLASCGIATVSARYVNGMAKSIFYGIAAFLITEVFGQFLAGLVLVITNEDEPELDESENAFAPVDDAEKKLMKLAPREFFCQKFLNGKVVRTNLVKGNSGHAFARYWYRDDNWDCCYCGSFYIERTEACDREKSKLVIREDAAVLQIPLSMAAEDMDAENVVQE
jgi:hypothetical protein